MHFKKPFLLIFIAIPCFTGLKAQQADTITTVLPQRLPVFIQPAKPVSQSIDQRGGWKRFVVPGILLGYGFGSLESGKLKSFNNKVKEEIWQENPHLRTSVDDYLRFAPALAVYGLNAAGIKGKNNFRDRSMIYVVSNVFVCSSVFGLKKLTHELRPDGSDYYSFPSGHTAAAFAAAEFMRQEYKDVSPWYGVAGYVAAGTTGMLRMYNNKHWMSDVLAGAGIGIASTKLAYLVYPVIKKKLFKDKAVNTMVMPYYQHKGAGLAMVMHLN